jgi:hypothetical protein
MKGICKTGNGLYVTSHFNGTHVLINLTNRQKWKFVTRDDGKVELRLRNILIVMSEKKFFDEWKIVEKLEGWQ